MTMVCAVIQIQGNDKVAAMAENEGSIHNPATVAARPSDSRRRRQKEFDMRKKLEIDIAHGIPWADLVGSALLHLKRLGISPTVRDVEVDNWNERVPWKAKQR